MISGIARSRFSAASQLSVVADATNSVMTTSKDKSKPRARACDSCSLPCSRAWIVSLGVFLVFLVVVIVAVRRGEHRILRPRVLHKTTTDPAPLSLNPLRLPLSFPTEPLYTTFRDGEREITTKIPRILHVTFGLSGPDASFGLMQYLSLVSALDTLHPSVTMMHVLYPPTGMYWELLASHVTLVKHAPVTEIFGNPVNHYAHKADIIRLRALKEHGGIYMDLDVVFLRDITPLLQHDFVMGQEGEKGRIGLCNAIILAHKDSAFLNRWYESYREFNGSQWNYHSVLLPKVLAELYPREITVLEHRAFFWPLWDKDGLPEMYRGFTYDYSHNYAVHMWNSALERSEYRGITQSTLLNPPSRLLQHLQIYVVDPLFTIVMPCYNQRDYIRDSILAVVRQDWTRWELLIVDDASPDKCGEFVVSELAKEPLSAWASRIRVIVNPVNKGLAESRNVAIREAAAPWICALDSDDLISTNYLSAAEAAMTADPALELIYADQQFFGASDWHWDVPSFDPVTTMQNGPLPVMTLYRKSLWADVGGYRSLLPWGNEDYDFWLRVAGRNIRHHKMSYQVRSMYRYKAESMMRVSDRYKKEERGMLRLLNPHLFPVAAVLTGLEDVAHMSPETAVRLQTRKNYAHLSEEDTLYINFFLALQSEITGKETIAIDYIYKALIEYFESHPELSGKWIPLFVRGRYLCETNSTSAKHMKEGARLLNAAATIQPALIGNRQFHRALTLCSVSTHEV